MDWLSGVRILDFSSNVAGPVATLTLGRLGARVIKVERPDGDPSREWAPRHGDSSLTFDSLNRGKRSLVVDLKARQGRALIASLLSETDVLIHNFGPGIAERLALDEPSVRADAPNILYCAVGAFGSGPVGKVIPGYDPVAQAFTGIMEMTGYADGPGARCAPSSIDISTGQWIVIGVLTALYDQAMRKSAEPRITSIEASLVDSAMGFIPYQAVDALLTGRRPQRYGTANPLGAPHQVFATGDRPLFIGAPSQDKWETLCRLLDAVELIEDRRFISSADRLENVVALERELTVRLARESSEHWRQCLLAAGIATSEVLNLDETVRHPLAVERGWFEPGQIPVLRMPLLMNDDIVASVGAAPKLGEHSVDVLTEIGMSSEKIRELIATGVVHQLGH